MPGVPSRAPRSNATSPDSSCAVFPGRTSLLSLSRVNPVTLDCSSDEKMKLPLQRAPLSIALTTAVVAQIHVLSAFANNADSADESLPWLSLLLPTLLILGAAVAATLVVRRWKGAIGGRDGPLQLVHVIA